MTFEDNSFIYLLQLLLTRNIYTSVFHCNSLWIYFSATGSENTDKKAYFIKQVNHLIIAFGIIN